MENRENEQTFTKEAEAAATLEKVSVSGEIEESNHMENSEESTLQEESKKERQMFLCSPFLLFGLLLAATVSVFILSKGQGGKELIFHSVYIVMFLVYALIFFVAKKKLPKKIIIEQKAKRLLFDAADCLFTVLIAFVLSVFVLDCFRISVVNGQSMDDTLYDGEKLILSMHAYDFEEMKRGDIVVCDAPQLEEYIIKRIIALPSDHLVIKDNQVYVNDTLLKEDYIKEPMVTEDLDIVVPKGKLFVMGDNRNNSGDSRWDAVGYIDIENDLQGKIVFKSLKGVK